MPNLTASTSLEFEKNIKDYLQEANERLNSEFMGTREAIKMIAREKIQEYIMFTDKGFEKKEMELLSAVCTAAMVQAFCYGYGIGKVEGQSNRKICL